MSKIITIERLYDWLEEYVSKERKYLKPHNILTTENKSEIILFIEYVRKAKKQNPDPLEKLTNKDK